MTTSLTRTSPSHLHGDQGVESPLPADLLTVLLRWLTQEEIDQIRDQFHRTCIPNRQLLWSGMLTQTAQGWADGHGYQTLTTAMGPLMKKSSPECPFRRKLKTWPEYVHGASVIFAWHIAQGDVVTVLSQPPPQRFHPSGKTFYESVEQPIIQGVFGNRAVKKIFVVHPMVKDGAEFPPYQMWPKDEASMWLAAFGEQCSIQNWRLIPKRRKKDLSAFLKAVRQDETISLAPTAAEAASFPVEEKNLGQDVITQCRIQLSVEQPKDVSIEVTTTGPKGGKMTRKKLKKQRIKEKMKQEQTSLKIGIKLQDQRSIEAFKANRKEKKKKRRGEEKRLARQEKKQRTKERRQQKSGLPTEWKGAQGNWGHHMVRVSWKVAKARVDLLMASAIESLYHDFETECSGHYCYGYPSIR